MPQTGAGATLFFDVETQRLADEVGGWGHISRLGLAAAVTYSTSDGQFHRYTEEQVQQLVEDLLSAELVVGFNVLRFDYEVLRPYTKACLRERPTVDMLDCIYQRLGFRVGLDALASATLSVGKSADGLDSVRWYRQGLLDKVFAYCEEDVALTRDLYTFGRLNGYVQFRDRNGRLRQVEVRW